MQTVHIKYEIKYQCLTKRSNTYDAPDVGPYSINQLWKNVNVKILPGAVKYHITLYGLNPIINNNEFKCASGL